MPDMQLVLVLSGSWRVEWGRWGYGLGDDHSSSADSCVQATEDKINR